MLRTIIIALLLSACAASPHAQHAAPSTAESRDAAADALLAADRQTASAVTPSDGLSGLLATFDDSVVLFAPPVPGFAQGSAQARETLTRAIGGNATALTVSPVRAGVSADGQHGFTFGYASVSRAGSADFIAKYVAYWVRDNGRWRIRLYKLVPRPEGDHPDTMMAPYLPSSPATATNTANFAESLARREREFSDASQTEGLSHAFARFGRSDAVNVGGDAAFVVGAEAISGVQPDGPSPLSWSADQGVLVSPSGDLGVTWGFLRRNGPTPPGRLAEIPFFTIWARETPDQPWLYIAE